MPTPTVPFHRKDACKSGIVHSDTEGAALDVVNDNSKRNKNLLLFQFSADNSAPYRIQFDLLYTF
jgi:hypothetical protein